MPHSLYQATHGTVLSPDVHGLTISTCCIFEPTTNLFLHNQRLAVKTLVACDLMIAILEWILKTSAWLCVALFVCVGYW